MKGIIIKSTGKWYNVRLENQEVIRCRIKGKFKLEGLRLTNPVAVGDRVLLDQEKGLDTGIITKVLARDNYILRQSTRRRHFMHLIASNLDQVVLISTIKYPSLKLGFIDRFLLTSESHNIPTYIIINKADLYTEDDLELYYGVKAIYERIGYKTLLTSATTGEGVNQLKDILKDKVTLIAGHSGVGKSTLTNAIQPGLELVTQEISDYTNKGMHTTTFAEMHPLDFGGQLIDTPGIKEFGFINMSPQDVAHNYKEFFEYSSKCKFGNCLHINEPKCAVKEAVENGEISELRYQSYLSIQEEVAGRNYWERQTDW
ncbi:MAG: ribosome small subunit-dependent GTPase A [Saprospiraceae bacterium]|nr:ribosome small subunit-dependent GTPase A [Saprospiraceae bacterium]